MERVKQALAALEGDIRRLGVAFNSSEWEHISQRCKFVQVPAGGKIQNQLRVADSWIFLTDGIAASEQTWPDGKSTIARFFETDHICSNVTSAWTRDFAQDDLIALTDVTGLTIPDEIFRREYLEGGFFGLYLRYKLMDAHLFAKELICAKTSGQTETRYQFLEQYHQKDNGQFCVVLNHALLRGISAEMIHWWFLNFPRLKVGLKDVPGFEGHRVPGYLLWHPVDHLSAELLGPLGPDGVAQPGCSIHIREAMQYDRYGWKYPVDAKLKVFYVGCDGWAMGKTLPLVGPVMMLRIHFKDVYENGQHIGVHYHYEVVIGASGKNPIARFINKRITGQFGPEFFAAWHRHNVIEVGTFENFLQALFAQRDDLSSLEYRRAMNPNLPSPDTQQGYDKALFERRLKGYMNTDTPYEFQLYQHTSFL